MKRLPLWLVLAGGCSPAPSLRTAPPLAATSPPAEAPPATAVSAEPTAEPAGHSRLSSAEAAVAAYFALFPDATQVRRDDDVMRARATLSAPCSQSTARIVDVMGPRPELTVGTLEALDRDAPCWVVNVPKNPFQAAQGYFDQATGELLAVWDIPEG